MIDWGDRIESPKKAAPLTSWWADPVVQTDREKFNEWAKAQQERIVGSPRFGGTKKVIDKFPASQKKSQR